MKNNRKTCFIMGMLLVVAVAATGCRSYDDFKAAFASEGGSTGDATIEIGIYEPFTGNDSQWGKLELKGIRLAHMNKSRILEKKVKLIEADNCSDTEAGKTAIKELVEKAPSAVLGSWGSLYSLMAGRYLRQEKIPAVAPCSTSAAVTDGDPYYFRLGMTGEYEGRAMAAYGADVLKADKVAVMIPEGDSEAAMAAAAFVKGFKEKSGDPESLTTQISYMPGGEDLGYKVQTLKASGAKAVFLPTEVKDGVKIIKQAEKAGIKIRFLGTNKWNDDEFEAAVKEYRNVQIAFDSVISDDIWDTEEGKRFLEAYNKEYGKESKPSEETVLAYDAYMVMAQAIEKAGTEKDGDKIRNVMETERDFTSVTGVLGFDDRGGPVKDVCIRGSKGGKIVALCKINWKDI